MQAAGPSSTPKYRVLPARIERPNEADEARVRLRPAYPLSHMVGESLRFMPPVGVICPTTPLGNTSNASNPIVQMRNKPHDVGRDANGATNIHFLDKGEEATRKSNKFATTYLRHMALRDNTRPLLRTCCTSLFL